MTHTPSLEERYKRAVHDVLEGVIRPAVDDLPRRTWWSRHSRLRRLVPMPWRGRIQREVFAEHAARAELFRERIVHYKGLR